LQPIGGTPLVLTPATAKALLVNPPMVSETIDELGLNKQGLTAQQLLDGPLEVEPVSATNLVRLSVTLPDPAAAHQIASRLASKAIELMNRVERDAPSAERPALEKQLTEADRHLKDAADRLVAFATSGNLEAPDPISADDQRRARADGLRIELEGERARLATLEQELARQPEALRSMLQHDMALSRARIARLDTERRQLGGSGTGREAIAKRAETYRQSLELSRLRSEYEARARTSNDLRLRLERTQTLTAQLYMVAPPALPNQPVPRRRRQFATLGAIVGLMCGIAVALVIDGRNSGRA
jgi:capsule polysaccharide export protein KpsE/RkpR